MLKREKTILLSNPGLAEPEQFIKGFRSEKRVYKMVLTGGPCGGKTTGQAKLATFFENLGWKVYRVPETATVLMSGGIAFGELNTEQVMDFQENLIRTMLALEDTYFSMAQKSGQNCLVICDRGTMDASAFISRDQWLKLLEKVDLDEEHICEGRYDHVVHMVSAAVGAEDFYSCDQHAARFEGIELARERDRNAMNAWTMHPYVDIVDNRIDFDNKLKRLVDIVVRRIGLEIGDQFKANSRKVKFVIKGPMPAIAQFPSYADFEVEHHYLRSGLAGIQSRLRKRSHQGRTTYTCTVRRPEKKGQIIEEKTSLSKKDYENLLNHVDERHMPIFKTRRCFLYQHQQYQLDVYRDPCHPRCRGLILLETFTTLPPSELQSHLPPFLQVALEVTGDPAFSMFNLALRSDWIEKSHHFCHRLSLSASAIPENDLERLKTQSQEAQSAQKRFTETIDQYSSDYSSGTE
eukprot:maker-scaffold387_size188669-snap-gene-0.14 protein:Tk03872 transcript:maker-scaffold387_size188669-snap-gene-0.14-mRNA-1 annotation:"hypothetical protein EAI_01984"